MNCNSYLVYDRNEHHLKYSLSQLWKEWKYKTLFESFSIVLLGCSNCGIILYPSAMNSCIRDVTIIKQSSEPSTMQSNGIVTFSGEMEHVFPSRCLLITYTEILSEVMEGVQHKLIVPLMRRRFSFSIPDSRKNTERLLIIISITCPAAF